MTPRRSCSSTCNTWQTVMELDFLCRFPRSHRKWRFISNIQSRIHIFWHYGADMCLHCPPGVPHILRVHNVLANALLSAIVEHAHAILVQTDIVKRRPGSWSVSDFSHIMWFGMCTKICYQQIVSACDLVAFSLRRKVSNKVSLHCLLLLSAINSLNDNFDQFEVDIKC